MISDFPKEQPIREFTLPITINRQGKKYIFNALFKAKTSDEAAILRDRLMAFYGIPTELDNSFPHNEDSIFKAWQEMKEIHEIKGTQGKNRPKR